MTDRPKIGMPEKAVVLGAAAVLAFSGIYGAYRAVSDYRHRPKKPSYEIGWPEEIKGQQRFFIMRHGEFETSGGRKELLIIHDQRTGTQYAGIVSCRTIWEQAGDHAIPLIQLQTYSPEHVIRQRMNVKAAGSGSDYPGPRKKKTTK